ncbi:MAG: helix-turn-helix transcriptional regulator [Clostridia bacterium]|nr:helix-turn-helix transcriptional regulator [Clostridia bacterium]
MVITHLPELLGRRRMTQQQLAQETGIRPSTISNIYNDMCIRINIDYIDKICEVLDCRIDELFEYIPNEVKCTGKYLIKDPHGNREKP